jgi:hypothetical protein
MGLKKPIRCTFVVCCARAARGSPVAAPLRTLMKSRRRLRYLVGGEQSAQVTSYQFSSHVVPRPMHHRRLLRGCRMRPPNRGRAAEQDDELPPSHRSPVPRCGDASSISAPNPCRMQNSGNSASQLAHTRQAAMGHGLSEGRTRHSENIGSEVVPRGNVKAQLPSSATLSHIHTKFIG